MSPTTCSHAVLALVASLTLFAAPLASTAAEAPQPTASSGSDRPRLPVIGAQGPSSRVRGKIVRSSRGHRGPVRLQVERKDGSKVMVLVGPDSLCEQLGLSLRVGESVDVEGAMLKTKEPILVARSFTVDGRTIRVREENGKLVTPPSPSPSPGAEDTAAPSPGTTSDASGESPAAPSAE